MVVSILYLFNVSDKGFTKALIHPLPVTKSSFLKHPTRPCPLTKGVCQLSVYHHVCVASYGGGEVGVEGNVEGIMVRTDARGHFRTEVKSKLHRLDDHVDKNQLLLLYHGRRWVFGSTLICIQTILK